MIVTESPEIGLARLFWIPVDPIFGSGIILKSNDFNNYIRRRFTLIYTDATLNLRFMHALVGSVGIQLRRS
jgi:hypothetical protein